MSRTKSEIKPIYGDVTMVVYLPFSMEINAEIFNVLYKNSLINDFCALPLDAASLVLQFRFSRRDPDTLVNIEHSFLRSSITIISDSIRFVLGKYKLQWELAVTSNSMITLDLNDDSPTLMTQLLDDYKYKTITVDELRRKIYSLASQTSFNGSQIVLESFGNSASYRAIEEFVFERYVYVLRTSRN